jgi:hypothetical protein
MKTDELAVALVSMSKSRDELAKMVAEMRLAQRTYFRVRTPEALEHSKELERRVDLAVKAILEKQQSLF